MDNQDQYKQDEEDDYNELFKVVLVGDAGVGKTHMMNRYVRGQLPKNSVPTIGIEFAAKTVTLKQAKIKAQIWDTAGQERYRGITSTHFRRAGGALVVYDVTKDKSFESVQKWIEELRYQAEPDIVIMLVGNKIDLVEKNQQARKVQVEDAKLFAAQFKVLFKESSAVTGQNVTDCFESLLQEMYTVKTKTGGLSSGPQGIKLDNANSQNTSDHTDCKC